MNKELSAIKNHAGGYDLATERDRGNQVLILTGRYSNSVEYWKRMKRLAEDVLFQLEEVNEESHDKTITV